jgi:hypothetical protein
MPFITAGRTLERAWEDVSNAAIDLRADATAQRNAAQAGNVQSTFILGFESRLRGKRAQIVDLAATPNLAAYVTGLPNTPAGYNVANEYTAMLGQIDATIGWIRTNFPKDASGYLLERKFNADQTQGLNDRVFSAAELSGYVTQLNALLAALGTAT